MRVSFDVDGVIADFVLSFTREAYKVSKLFPIDVDIYRTNEQKVWKFPWPNDFYDEVWEEIDNTYNWWMTLEPIVTTQEVAAINFLIKEHDVYFITSRKRTLGLPACKQTSLWLESIGINASHAVTIATQPDKKHQLINALDIDCHIDDKPNIIELVNNHSGAISCVRRWEYNVGALGQEWFNNLEEYAAWITRGSRTQEQSLITCVTKSLGLREKIIL